MFVCGVGAITGAGVGVIALTSPKPSFKPWRTGIVGTCFWRFCAGVLHKPL